MTLQLQEHYFNDTAYSFDDRLCCPTASILKTLQSHDASLMTLQSYQRLLSDAAVVGALDQQLCGRISVSVTTLQWNWH